ncbi:MAG TPA: type 4a pilus biogenesis protein PilO [Pyrinomonadaceae bacterium]|nr:type 4a pilus biogenesis protein PilO [Pyrinomonadaceae bacterium]
MLDKIKNLQWHFQLLLLVGIASLVYASVWYFVTSPTRELVRQKNDEIAALQAKNEAARVATQRINEFRALYASKAVEYEELKVLLPEQREITNVLQGLQDNARDSKMIVMRFSPRDDSQQDVIMAKPVEIEVDSNFTNLRAFFDKMAKLPRIVSISDFEVNQLDKQSAMKTLHAQFLLTAYYADPETMNKPAAPAKGAKGAKAGAAKPAAAAQPAAAAK